MEVISHTAAGEVNVQYFHEIDEQQDDKIFLEGFGLHQINPISMQKWDWGKKKICARQNTSTKSKFFHKLHVTLYSIFPFPPFCGTCTALPLNVGVEETKNPLGVFPSIFFSAALSPSVLLLALQLHRDLMQLKKPNCWSCTTLPEHGWVPGSWAAHLGHQNLCWNWSHHSFAFGPRPK